MIQDIPQTALALAVLTLGFVVALELRSLKRLRQMLNRDLQRLFEQLDLVRFDGQQLAEAQQQQISRAPQRTAVALPIVQGSVAADYAASAEIARRPGLAAGEARVLVALQKMRSERGSTH